MTRVQTADGLFGPLRRAAGAWNRFWFNPADPTTLGLIRICGGLLVLYLHIAYTYDLQAIFGSHAWVDTQMMDEFRKEYPVPAPPLGWQNSSSVTPPQTSEDEHYTEKWGINPSLLLGKGRTYLCSIWFHLTDPTWMLVVHCAVLAIMFCFAIGFCTRVMAVLTWAAMLSYVQRGPATLFGMDAMTMIVILYLTIGPSGAALSVDRLITRYWLARRARRQHLPIPKFGPPEPSVSANVAIRLLQIHFCIIYFISGLSKLQGGAWWNGTAVWLTMANYEFSPMRMKLYMDALRFIAVRRWLWELVTTGGTYFTLAFEISFPFLIWTRWGRPVVIAAAVFMHLGIAFCMGLVTFSMVMLTGVLSFVPPEVVRGLLDRLGQSLRSLTRRQIAPGPEKARAIMMAQGRSA